MNGSPRTYDDDEPHGASQTYLYVSIFQIPMYLSLNMGVLFILSYICGIILQKGGIL